MEATIPEPNVVDVRRPSERAELQLRRRVCFLAIFNLSPRHLSYPLKPIKLGEQ